MSTFQIVWVRESVWPLIWGSKLQIFKIKSVLVSRSPFGWGMGSARTHSPIAPPPLPLPPAQAEGGGQADHEGDHLGVRVGDPQEGTGRPGLRPRRGARGGDLTPPPPLPQTQAHLPVNPPSCLFLEPQLKLLDPLIERSAAMPVLCPFGLSPANSLRFTTISQIIVSIT